jgi:hypothetical protein
LVPGTSTKAPKEKEAPSSTSDKENSSSLANAELEGVNTKVADANAKCSLDTLDKVPVKGKADADDEFDDEDALEALVEAERMSSPVGKA